ncbi:ferredoxin [Rhodococcus sp. NPDC057014]|uniref:ferredoxin n=1 Tax=Rhodococcus sp. NPDC057014 TaxID=3346000 RepID=UPI00362CE450
MSEPVADSAGHCILIDTEICVGSTLCVQLAPDTFVLDARGKSQVIPTGVPDDETMDDVIGSCPTQAIGLVEGANPRRIEH